MMIALYILLGLIALILLLGLVAKKEIAAEKFVIIHKPKQEVFDFVKMLKNQDSYSKWGSLDPNMQKTYSGTDGTKGFVSAWDSNQKNVGKGEQEIVGIKEGERIDYALRFMKPMKSFADAYMTTTSVNNNETKVVWGFKSKMIYPFNVMCLFVNMDEMVGKDFRVGLENLKKKLEA